VMSAVRIARPVIRAMQARGSGDIVFIGSRAAREPAPEIPLSSIMRLGLARLAQILAKDFARDNIRVNFVAPGYFATAGNRRRVDELMRHEGLTREDAAAQLAKHVPLGRFGDADELGALIVFLVSRRASFMTGAALTIDGGASSSVF